jgi:glycosyltransferase involved in cell wall biosynthesis
MPDPLVTIAMPCLNEADYIETCLRSVQAQTYPPGCLEILVADGGSHDGTRDILARLSTDDPRIRLIDNPDRIQAAGLNRILEQSRGDILVRMDVHCEYAPDYVEKCVEVLERTGADNVGGAARCRGETEFQKAVCAALRSPLGAGGAPHWDPRSEGFVQTVPFGALQRSVLQSIGGWDPGAITNEDAELNQRLIDTGRRIYLSPEIVFHYAPRGSLRALGRQYFRYGQGRARTLLKHRRFLTPRPALPFLAVLTGLVLIAALPWTPAALYAAAAALALISVEAVRVGLAGGLAQTARVAAILPTIVTSHGAGFGLGLIRYLTSPDWPDAPKPAA